MFLNAEEQYMVNEPKDNPVIMVINSSDDESEVRLASISTFSMNRIVQANKVKLLGYMLYKNYNIFVFGASHDKNICTGPNRTKFSYIHPLQHQSKNSPNQPPMIFEPTVYIYTFKEDKVKSEYVGKADLFK
ncbi:hypothetical protein D770_04285 [Flammeovirgaceae bacterium 311]|nr:hypothetical protein D770_04285 [Flammeovirgaceae bacterium 311]